MAEIHVAPNRRNRTIVLTIIAVAVLAALAWFFLVGPGAAATGA